MVTAPLVDSKVDAGRRLVEFLDQFGFRVDAALWLFRQEATNWRLILASPLVDSLGPRETYRKLQHALAGSVSLEQPLTISLNEIQVVSPEDELIRLLRVAVSTGSTLSGIRLTGNTIDGVYIDDAYIYRIR